MAIVTPVIQNVKLDPFNGRLFEFNNADSRIYLTRTINTMLDIYGQNVVVDGLDIIPTSLLYNAGLNTLTFTIRAGSTVIDQTLAAITADEIISISTAGFNLVSKSFAIFVNFEYLNQFGGNKMRLKTVWFDPVLNTTAAVTDIDSRDRVLVGVVDFDVTGLVPGIRVSNAYNVTTLSGNGVTVTINGVTYPYYPRSTISDNLARILIDTFY